MKCSGKHDTILHEPFRVVSRFPSYISCFIAENRFPLGQCSGNCLTKYGNFFEDISAESEEFVWPWQQCWCWGNLLLKTENPRWGYHLHCKTIRWKQKDFLNCWYTLFCYKTSAKKQNKLKCKGLHHFFVLLDYNFYVLALGQNCQRRTL